MISSIHVVPHIRDEAAGPSYTVPRLCESLIAMGDRVQLHCLGDVPSQWDFPVQSHYQWRFPERVGVSPEMLSALRVAAGKVDIMHNHSLWMMPNIYPAWVTRRKDCRLVTSPRGTLDPWAWSRSRWIKSIIWPIQKEALSRAACLHATAEAEWQHIRRKGFGAPVAIIPNGVDIPTLHRRIEDKVRELLFLGRIHPKKGVDLLLRVWAKIQGEFPHWRLRVVGPDNGGYLNHMQTVRSTLALERVSFEKPVYGDEKSKVFQSASLYILPTHTENFGMTVAEALANGVPAIVTKGAPWEGLRENGCGWWVERDEGILWEILREAMSLSTQHLREMGERGRQWMIREFSWKEIGHKMHLTYEWLLGGGLPPDWVRLK